VDSFGISGAAFSPPRRPLRPQHHFIANKYGDETDFGGESSIEAEPVQPAEHELATLPSSQPPEYHTSSLGSIPVEVTTQHGEELGKYSNLLTEKRIRTLTLRSLSAPRILDKMKMETT